MAAGLPPLPVWSPQTRRYTHTKNGTATIHSVYHKHHTRTQTPNSERAAIKLRVSCAPTHPQIPDTELERENERFNRPGGRHRHTRARANRSVACARLGRHHLFLPQPSTTLGALRHKSADRKAGQTRKHVRVLGETFVGRIVVRLRKYRRAPSLFPFGRPG